MNELLGSKEGNKIPVKERLPSEIKKELALINDPALKCVVLGGSQGAKSNGKESDTDIVTLFGPFNELDPVGLNHIHSVSKAIEKVVFRFLEEDVIVPVIATIRLEEAQIAMAEMLHPGKLIAPLHWLFYPSHEFALTNEPPKLMRDLVQGPVLLGQEEFARQLSSKAQSGEPVNARAAQLVTGVDWLTDTFRILLTNRGGQLPESFIKRQATHNLEYFLKWRIIAECIENITGVGPKSWNEIFKLKEIFPDWLWNLGQKSREIRHDVENIQLEKVVQAFDSTLICWGEIVKFKANTVKTDRKISL